MAKRSNKNVSHDISSSEDEFQVDVYSDQLEKLNISGNDSSDSDIIQPAKQRRNYTTKKLLKVIAMKIMMKKTHWYLIAYRQVKSGLKSMNQAILQQ